MSASPDSAPSEFPSEPATFFLPGPAGRLEVAVDLPEPAEARPVVAIVCHPLPTEGGTMRNKVVTITERALRELGAKTVRVNFRGAGESEGEFDNGRGETLDLLAVAEWVRKVLPDHDMWLAGFSFGAYIRLLGARHLPGNSNNSGSENGSVVNQPLSASHITGGFKHSSMVVQIEKFGANS